MAGQLCRLMQAVDLSSKVVGLSSSTPINSILSPLNTMRSVLTCFASDDQTRSVHHQYPYKAYNGKWSLRCTKAKRKNHVTPFTGVYRHKNAPVQEWWDWDGFGPYKYRHHHYANNITLRDVQRRRIFTKFQYQRARLMDLRRNDVLPPEVQQIARNDVEKMPLDSSIARPNKRCVVTGRARGNYHEFRVSRFIWRNEADHNRVSGAQRAFWMYNTIIKP